MTVTPTPFTIAVPDAVLADLRARLERVRWPDEPPAAGWKYGTDLTYMRPSGRTTTGITARGRSGTASA